MKEQLSLNKDKLITKEFLENKIYIIRGQKVMLNHDLALIYGYATKAFNQQIKNNIEKFDEDFMFQLTRGEVESLVRSKILTSPNVGYDKRFTKNSNIYSML